IECLKKSGLQIRDIKQFMLWCKQGAQTYEKRRALFERQKQEVSSQIEQLNLVMAMLEFKIWYYSKAIEDGSEENLKKIIPKDLPPKIKELWSKTHKDDTQLSK
ncbi:MAG: MerR family transcriptional regulator, partial [Succinivibrio sp.]